MQFIEGDKHPRRPWWVAGINNDGAHVWKRRPGELKEDLVYVVQEGTDTDEALARIDRRDPLWIAPDEAYVVNWEITRAAHIAMGFKDVNAGEDTGLRDYSLHEMVTCTRIVDRQEKHRQEARKAAAAGGQASGQYTIVSRCDERMLAALYALWHWECQMEPLLTWKPQLGGPLERGRYGAKGSRALFVLDNDAIDEIADNVIEAREAREGEG